MNWIEVREKWQQMVPLLMSTWPALSHQDLGELEGQRDMLARLLERRYGLTPEQTEEAIARFEKDVRFPGAVK